MTTTSRHPETLSLHAGWRADSATGAVADLRPSGSPIGLTRLVRAPRYTVWRENVSPPELIGS
jgi:hypothetical protein